jgi:hypothetical protein
MRSALYRNIFSHVPSGKVRKVAAMLTPIHASEDIEAAREKARQVIEKLRASRAEQACRVRGRRLAMGTDRRAVARPLIR